MTYLLITLTVPTIAFLYNNFSKRKIPSHYILCSWFDNCRLYCLLFNKGLGILVSLQLQDFIAKTNNFCNFCKFTDLKNRRCQFRNYPSTDSCFCAVCLLALVQHKQD